MKLRKKIICFILLIQMFFAFSNEQVIRSYIEDKYICFSIVDTYDNFLGYLIFDNGNISCSGLGIILCNIDEVIYSDNDIEIYFYLSAITNHYEDDESFFIRRWSYPHKFKITVLWSSIKKVYEEKNEAILIVDTTQTYPTTCQAIVIDNLNIRDTPSLSGKKIGMLPKASEVTLYEQSKNQEEIDGEKNFWYKVKVDEETYGWVYGAYVRIFFEDPSLGYSDKEKILESIKD